MIPGNIEEWKKALKSSKPGEQRGACVLALLSLGVSVEINDGDAKSWRHLSLSEFFHCDYRVEPTPRPWNAEDARGHVGKAWRCGTESGIIGVYDERSFEPWKSDDGAWLVWEGYEYAEPKWGTDPSAWNWQKCEVVE